PENPRATVVRFAGGVFLYTVPYGTAADRSRRRHRAAARQDRARPFAAAVRLHPGRYSASALGDRGAAHARGVYPMARLRRGGVFRRQCVGAGAASPTREAPAPPVTQYEIRWATLPPPVGRRPVLLL